MKLSGATCSLFISLIFFSTFQACSSKDGASKNEGTGKDSGCRSEYQPLDVSYNLGAAKPLECISLSFTDDGHFLIDLTEKNPTVWPRLHVAISEYEEVDKRVKSGKLYTILGTALLTPSGEEKAPEITDSSAILDVLSFSEGGRSAGTLTLKQGERTTTIKFDGITRKSQ